MVSKEAYVGRWPIHRLLVVPVPLRLLIVAFASGLGHIESLMIVHIEQASDTGPLGAEYTKLIVTSTPWAFLYHPFENICRII